MQRISDVFSNWLEEAFSEGGRRTNHPEPNDEGNSQSEPDEERNPEIPNPESTESSNGRSTPTALLSVHSGGTDTPDSDVVDPCIETKPDEVVEENYTGNDLGTVESIESFTEDFQSNLIGSETCSVRGCKSEAEISHGIKAQDPGRPEILDSHERESVTCSLTCVEDRQCNVDISKSNFELSSNSNNFTAKQEHKQSCADVSCGSEARDDSCTTCSNIQSQSEIGEFCVLGVQSSNDEPDSNSMYQTDKQNSRGTKKFEDDIGKSEHASSYESTNDRDEDTIRDSPAYKKSVAASSSVANESDSAAEALAHNQSASRYESDPVDSATIKSSFVNNQIAQYLADSASDKYSQNNKGVLRKSRAGDTSEERLHDLNENYKDTDDPRLVESKECSLIRPSALRDITQNSTDDRNEPEPNFCATDRKVVKSESELADSDSKRSPINDSEEEQRENIAGASSGMVPRRVPSSNEDDTRLRTTINDSQLQTRTSHRHHAPAPRTSPNVDSSRLRAGNSTSSDEAASRRETAATRIQRCFRLQKKHAEQFSSFDDADDGDDDNVLVPRLLSSYKGHRNARTMV